MAQVGVGRLRRLWVVGASVLLMISAALTGCGEDSSAERGVEGARPADPSEPRSAGGDPDGAPSGPDREVVGSWQPFDAGPLATRGEPKAVWTGTEMVVVGGLAIERYAAFADGAAYDAIRGTWRRIASRPLPGRIMVVAWTGSEVFALGRREGIELEDMRSVHLYDPAADSWREATPPPRGFNSPEGAWWTGREVLVWQLGGGMLYDPADDKWRDVPAIDIAGAAAPGRAVWLDGAGILAVQGAMTPKDGGPLRDSLFTFDPQTRRWRVAAMPPAATPGFNLLYAAWTGAEVVLNADSGGATYAYSPVADAWRELPTPAVQRDRGTAYFQGVPLGGGRAAIRIGDSQYPLIVAEANRGWSYVAAPAGKVPAPDGVVLWTGRDLILWGRPDEANPSDPNAAWKWTP